MRSEPTLRARSIPSWTPRYSLTFRVEGGLNYLRGNSKPYFSLTCWEHRKGFPNQCQAGGCNHEKILKYYPELADLAALHLADIDGVPMHAESNGWYQLAGALPGNAGEQYHVGNSARNFPLPKDRIDPEKPWKDYETRVPTEEECLRSFAEHVRVNIETARKVRDDVADTWKMTRVGCELSNLEPGATEAPAWTKASWRLARAWFAQWIEEQKPRWKAEADACIKRHSLKVYGDPWPNPNVAA